MPKEHTWFYEYCHKTTSHCMQYFVMKHRSIIEKFFWILIFICVTTMTVFSLRILINIWITSPTVMFIENTESSIREIPFPSITICPSNQQRKWIWMKYRNTNTSYWENLQNYQDFICSSYMALTNRIVNKRNKYFDYESIKTLVNDCGISCSEVFQSDIKWKNKTIPNFCQYIQPILTVIGVCYTLNMLPTYQMLNDEYYNKYMDFFSKNNTFTYTELSDWNIDDGYLNELNDMVIDTIPARTSGISYYHRLRLMLHILDDTFLKCTENNYRLDGSFLMMINNPSEFYSFRSRSFIVPETYSKIQITPFVKKINKDLVWRSLEIRKCYLRNERKLNIFKLYSESNCNNECIINKTISICDCVPIEMTYLVPRDIKICSPLKDKCILKATQETYKSNSQAICNCLPTCTTIEYQISHTYHYDDWSYMKNTNLVKNNSRGSTVEISFKNPYFIAYKSASILDLDSLISTIGGILSLLLGINIINIFEILFVIFQMIYNNITKLFNHQ